mgnify:CR=1 FL=1
MLTGRRTMSRLQTATGEGVWVLGARHPEVNSRFGSVPTPTSGAAQNGSIPSSACKIYPRLRGSHRFFPPSTHLQLPSPHTEGTTPSRPQPWTTKSRP